MPYHILNLRFDEDTYRNAQSLAKANFKKPNGEGNLAILLRHLIVQAAADPDAFKLTPPAKQPGGNQ